jgi:hypothetical protein
VKDVKKLKIDSVENNWRDYTSSSNLVNSKIANGEKYSKTILYVSITMRETLLVESILITNQLLKPNCINLAMMNKIRSPNAEMKSKLLGIVQELLSYLN